MVSRYIRYTACESEKARLRIVRMLAASRNSARRHKQFVYCADEEDVNVKCPPEQIDLVLVLLPFVFRPSKKNRNSRRAEKDVGYSQFNHKKRIKY